MTLLCSPPGYHGVSKIINSENGKAMKEQNATTDNRIRLLELSTELCGLYAKDESEKANIAAINNLTKSFQATTGALFYMNGNKKFHYCLSGVDYPIALPESRWKSSVLRHSVSSSVTRFGPWSPPLLEKELPYWISAKLYSFAFEGGYVFLGTEKGEWKEEDANGLFSIAEIIAPIIVVRSEREKADQRRREAESTLAGNERRLRDFIENSRDMIYNTNESDILENINAVGVNLLGYKDKNAIIGKSFSVIMFDPELRSGFLSRIAENGYVDDHETILKSRDGNVIYCLETAYSVKDDLGKIKELHGILKDISDRIANERNLWRMNIELAETNLKLQQTQALMVQREKLASIGLLAAGVAHEINNPLGFLRSNCAFIQKYVKKFEKAWEEVRKIPEPVISEIEGRNNINYFLSELNAVFAESDDGFERIMRIVGTLKSFSRIDQGDGFELYDVNAGIEGTLVVARNEIKYIAEVKKNFGVLPQIRARGNEINQVLLNIIINAAQAIESQKRSEKGIIGISTSTEGDHIVIVISDDGPGIPKNILASIFDPFFTTKAPGKGTGLGLSISYDIIVTKHGGNLSADSAPGDGTAFRISLLIDGPSRAGFDT